MNANITLDQIQLRDDRQAAKLFNLSPAAFRKWRLNGTGPKWYKVGGRVKYRDADLIAFLESCPSGGGQKINAR